MGECTQPQQADTEKHCAAEGVLGESEEIFKLLVSEVQDYAIFALDPQGIVLTWNTGAERLKGYKAEEIIGSHFSRFYAPEDLARDHPQHELELAIQNGKYEEEGWRIKRDGSRFWANVVITALRDSQGELRGFAKVTRDLTERKKAEEARLEEQRKAAYLEQLKESERVLDQVFSEAPAFMTLLSVPDYRFLKSNTQHQKLIRRSNFIGKTIREVEPELEAQGLIRLLDEVVRTGRPFVGKEMAVHYDGVNGEGPKTAYLDFAYQPLRRPSGEVYAIAAQGYDVTEKVLSRKAVENERENFRNLFRQTPEMVCILKGPDHVFEFVNEAHVKVLGFNATGMTVREAQPESIEVHGILDQVYKTAKTAELHEIPVTVTDRLRYFNLTYSARRDEAGRINGIMVLGVEVTEQVQARESLRTNQGRLKIALTETKALLNASPSFFGLVDPKTGALTICNDLALQVVGKGREDVFGKAYWECPWWKPLPNSASRIQTAIEKAMEGSASEFDIEYCSTLGVKERQIRWVTFRAVPYRGDSGKVDQIAVSGVEITERRNAEEQLRHSELRYRTLTEALPQLVWGSLPDGHVDYLNRQFAEYTGFGGNEQLGLGWLENVVHPDDRQRTYDHWMGALEGLHPYDLEFRIRRHDGAYRWFKTRGSPMRDETGRIVYWVGTCTDIEDQKRNLETLQTINEVGKAISAELDLNRLVQSITDAATKLTGAEFGAFFYNVLNEKGESYTLYTLSGVPKEAFSRFPMPRNTGVFGPTFRGEGVVRSDDITRDARYGKNAPYHGMPEGHLPVVSYLAVPVVARSGEVLGGLFFGHSKAGMFSRKEEDIIRGLVSQAAIAMDNAKLYQQLKEAIRVRDEFLSIASHELRTPLTGMKMQTQMFNRILAKNPPAALQPAKVTQLVAHMDRGLNRLVHLIDDMLDISRIQNGRLSFHFDTMELGSIVAETLEGLRPELSNAGIEVRSDLATDLFCELDRFRIEQVLTNLVTNAIRYAAQAPVDVTLTREGEGAVLRFQDHGPGISQANQEKVFKRFERLVSSDEVSGMGLGLYICKEIIEGHQGSIRVEGESGQGARFVIVLPLIAQGVLR